MNPTAIKTVDLWLHYGVRPILREINLEIQTGELVAVMGPNGMGKTTLLAAIAGALCPQKGHVEINGLRRRSSEEAELEIRRKVVYLPADPWLPGHLSGREFLLSVGKIWEIEDFHLMNHADRLFQLFNLDKQADSSISSYSSGQKKKIALCSALIVETPILILDEPFAGGLDPAGILALKRVLKRLAEREDVTVLMAAPVPELVEELAHRVAIIKDGQILALDTVENLRRLTACDGPLQDVLERLLVPETMESLDRYFEGREK